MQISFERDEQYFQQLAAPWDRLLEKSVTRAPFLLHAFQLNWWRTRGGGEWPQAELMLALGHEPDGELAAIAPLFLTEDRAERPILMLLGSIEIADVLDLIGSRDALEQFIPMLLENLEQGLPERRASLDLYNLPEGSFTRELMRTAAENRGWTIKEQRLQPSPYVALSTSWDAYLDNIDSKQRRELKRKMRRADSYPASVEWHLSQADGNLHAEVDAFLDLMALDPEKRSFLTESMRAHFHGLAQAAADGGWLQLAMLEVSGQPAFGYFNFDYDGKLWVYNSGFDPDHASLSPGWVLMGHLIQWAIDHQIREVDFLRGDEEYKYRLGGIDRWVTRMVLSR
jgi:CelD/BcsL family acetyltransferase involved in cellulose biosynthesis